MAKNDTSVNEDSTAPEAPVLETEPDAAAITESADLTRDEPKPEQAVPEQAVPEQAVPEQVLAEEVRPEQVPAAAVGSEGEAPQHPQLERDPGKTLGIVALVVAVIAGVVGIVLGVLSYRKSRAADFGGGFGMAAIIVGAITTVLLGMQLFLLANGMGIGGACDGRKPGVYELENGTVISCT